MRRTNLDTLTDEGFAALVAAHVSPRAPTWKHAPRLRDIQRAAETSERDLDVAGIPTRERKGARVTYTPSGPHYSRRYANEARTLRVTLERGAKAWFLAELTGVCARNREPSRRVVKVTPQQQSRAIDVLKSRLPAM